MTTKIENETFSLLIGNVSDIFWAGMAYGYAEGSPAQVEFNPTWVFRTEDSEDSKEQVLGFYHTHPGFPATPSPRDVRTMRAWVNCLGRPLLCLIEGSDGLRAFWFLDDESHYQERAVCQLTVGYNWILMGLTVEAALIKGNGE